MPPREPRTSLLIRAYVIILMTLIAVSLPRPCWADDGAARGGSDTWTSRPSRSFQYLFGARLSSFSAAGDGSQSIGAGVSTQSAGYENYGPLSIRATSHSTIGKSGYGVEGMMMSDLAIGGIYRINHTHGPLARIGLRGYMLGNERVWLSNFEAPSGHVGYQISRGVFLFEVAARTGLIVTGRQTLYGTFQNFEILQKRTLGHPSVELGGHLALGYGGLRGEVGYMHVNVADHLGTPLVVWNANVCFRTGAFGLCADYNSFKADVPRVFGATSGPAFAPLLVAYGGLSVGVWLP